NLFANRISLVGPTAVTYGNNLNATAETSEPAHTNTFGTATNSVWWSWSGLQNGLVTVVNEYSAANSIIEVYTNSALASLSRVAGNGSAQYLGSPNRASFVAEAGRTYQVAVSGVGDVSGPNYAGAGNIALSLRNLDLNLISVSSRTNADNTVAFTNTVQIGN